MRHLAPPTARVGIAVGLGVGGVLMFGGSALAATVGRYALTQSLQPFTRSDGAGARIALSADGSTLVTGAPHANGSQGRVVIYSRTGGAFVAAQTLQDPDGVAGNQFGKSGWMSSNGSVIELPIINVASGRATDILMYVRSGTTWALAQTITAPTGVSGTAFRGGPLSADGNTLFASDANGATYVYTRTATTWTQHQVISDPLPHGSAFTPEAVSANGTTMIASANTGSGRQTAIIPFVNSGGTWTEQGPAITDPVWTTSANPDDQFGRAVALSSDGSTAFVGAPGVGGLGGALFVYSRIGTTWTRTQSVIDTTVNSATNIQNGVGDMFGASVALSADANIALVGSGGAGRTAAGTPGPGATYAYARTGSIWTRVQTVANVNRVQLTANGALAEGVSSDSRLFAPLTYARKGVVVPSLATLWTVEHRWVQAQIIPKAGASHYTLYATSSSGAAPRTGVCRVVTTGIGRRVRCSVTLTPGTWTVIDEAESPNGIIALSSHRVTTS